VTQNTNSTFGNSNIPYDESDLGFGLRAGYDISEFLHHNIRYSLIRQTLSNVSQFASLAIQQQEGTNLNSLISNEFIYDRRTIRTTRPRAITSGTETTSRRFRHPRLYGKQARRRVLHAV